MKNNPLLSIIIVSYNTSQITVDCLKSIYTDKGLKDIPFEIIVIDNASPDDSVVQINKFIKSSKAKNCQLILNENVGFGKANNQGIRISKGNYILLLNPDTIILHSAISQSLIWLSAHPEAHMCSAQLLNKDLSIQASGGYFPNLANTIAWSLGFDDLPFFNSLVRPFHPHTPQFYTHEKLFLKDHQQDWVTGAFMLIRRSVVDKTKGFDESYFMYGEEVEWAYRMHLAFPKSQCWYLVGPQIIHLGGASAIKRSDPIVREYTGVISFFERHRPQWQTKVVKKVLKVNAFLRSLIIPIYKEVCSRI
ncbi:MAG: glycosyltransferase family 2 protein [Candidatus Shapirobacteria bacterium]|jgi:hypothetical protein